jgi:uncharacterized protein YndB with AHSA1/START domain/ketosteroid isomerase-like protein
MTATRKPLPDLRLTEVPTVKTGMLIRKPVAAVFEALVDPDVTTKFWFTKSSGRLEPGKQVRWDWEMYDVSVEVTAKTVEPNERIVIEWPGYSGPTTVEWRFAPQEDGTTFVTVGETGFTGSGDELAKYVADSTQGFTLLLAGLKGWLEHGVKLNLTADRYPAGVEEQELTTAWRGSRIAPARGFFQAIRDKSVDAVDAVFTKDAVYRVPHAPHGFPRETAGRAAIHDMLAGAFAAFADTKVTDRCHAVIDDPNLVIAQWSVDNGLRAGGRYINDGVSFFRLRDGRIAEYVEYYDPEPARAAFLLDRASDDAGRRQQ